MTYEQLKEYLTPFITENLVCIFKTGSQLFCGNCKDCDYVIITKEEINFPCFYVKELNADFFVMSVETLNKRLQDDIWRYKLSVCLAKADKSNIIYGELPELDIDILSRSYLVKIMRIEKEFADRTYFIGKGNLKTIVWGLGLYYIILNSMFSFTDEQKATLQKCHDNEVDSDFIYTFKTQMEYFLSVN